MDSASLVPAIEAKGALEYIAALRDGLIPSPIRFATSSAFEFLAANKKLIGFAAVSCFVISKLLKRRRLRGAWREVGDDVVILHTLPRGKYCPCLSPFSVKLETFFRMMDIPYVLDFEAPLGTPLKLPWITLNGVDYTDSEAIIQMLLEKQGFNPDEDVVGMNQAMETSMRLMMEEHFYWGMAHWRYVVDRCVTVFQHHDMPVFNRLIMRFIVTRVMYCAVFMQGIGRYSDSYINMLLRKDLRTLSVYLGNRQFFHGDVPHVVDCAMFAILSQVLYNMPRSTMATYINDTFPNLEAYTERMRRRFWGDWSRMFEPLPPTSGELVVPIPPSFVEPIA